MKKCGHYIYSILFVIICTICIDVTSHAKDKITWVYLDYPPFGICEGPNKHTGLLDQIIHILRENLTEYDHLEHTGNVKRVLYLLQREEGLSCTCGLNITPERMNKFCFSKPAIIAPGIGITTRKNLLEFFGARKKVSLTNILKNKKLTLGVSAERSYGDRIDPIINQFKDAKNVYTLHVGNINQSSIAMLIHNRIDYMLARPFESMYLAKNLGQENQIINIPLEESNDYHISYVACSNNEKGQKLVEKINHIIEKEKYTERYRTIMETWLDENYIDEFETLYKEKFLTTN